MTANSQLLTTTPKTNTRANQANNQNRNRIREMDITWKVFSWVGGGIAGKGTGKKKHDWQEQNRQVNL